MPHQVIIRNPGFLLLWGAHAVSTFGDALTTLTLVLLITERTHSVAAVGGLAVVLALPGIAIGLLSGVYVDRGDRRRIMVVGDVCRAVLLIALAAGAATSAGLPFLYAIAFLQAVVGTFFDPARAALMQVIVPEDEQVRANSLIQTATVTAELAGTALAGVLVAVMHTYWVSFAADAVTFALSAALVLAIRHVPAVPAGRHRPAWAAVAEGLRVVRATPALRAVLLVFGALAFALTPMAVMLTPYVVDTLHITVGWLGPIQAGDTVGTIIGGALLALVARRVRPRGLVLAGMVALGALIASIAVTTTVAGLMAVYFVFGLLTVTVQTGIGALTQSEVDNALMGRFIGLMSIVPNAVSVLSLAFSGAVGAALGVRTMFVVSGAVLAGGTAVAWYQLRTPRSA
ncbi:MFS transporter [Microbispora sp. KK1-11]|uniref:MFS transporter n=1 Tax=Microbispora sp. KK1-11 TaxID=2053005 RepID=UPI00115B7198|nr:MFS transporter [Microbispora sp. KK1-11]TQS27173.1 MFS transporter [Microbispora sp. KK1-11]